MYSLDPAPSQKYLEITKTEFRNMITEDVTYNNIYNICNMYNHNI
jgi:hypothetical protein